MASLLSMRLKPSLNVEESSKLVRKRLICGSALPSTNLNPSQEKKAIKLLSSKSTSSPLVIRKKLEETVTSSSCEDTTKDVNSEIKKAKMSLLVDYGTTSSDSES